MKKTITILLIAIISITSVFALAIPVGDGHTLLISTTVTGVAPSYSIKAKLEGAAEFVSSTQAGATITAPANSLTADNPIKINCKFSQDGEARLNGNLTLGVTATKLIMAGNEAHASEAPSIKTINPTISNDAKVAAEVVDTEHKLSLNYSGRVDAMDLANFDIEWTGNDTIVEGSYVATITLKITSQA